jgi:ABC-type branched-subunit amino acid transport system permease subunit
MRAAAIVRDLRRAVGDSAVLDGDLRHYGHDATEHHGVSGVPAAVVLPSSTHEVAATLRACDALELPVVPRGGGTGLAAGAVPLGGEVVLGLVTGVVSFGHMGFAALGAYACAFLTIPKAMKPGLFPDIPHFLHGLVEVHSGFVAAIVISGLVAALFALLVSPAIVGLAGIQAVAVAWSFARSRIGLRAVAAREDEPAARSLGLRVVRDRGVTWVLSAARAAALPCTRTSSPRSTLTSSTWRRPS